jgi:A/G-specific adenine glycosylase
MTARDVGVARRRLLRWYDRHRRDLPWRRTRDPYAIWVSEVMLQQTRVAAVVPYYERFLERFPTIAALAAAEEEQILAAWSGLGYYGRARRLGAAARYLVETHGGELPRDPELLRRVPGIGRYTAGAIASVAFGLPEPVVDGNVRRVLSRLFSVSGGRGGRAAEERLLWDLAARLIGGPRPGDFNQALMELGAVVCRPVAPVCDVCPLARSCRSRSRGTIARFPMPEARRTPVERHVAIAIVRQNGRVLLERPGAASPLRGAWDLPAAASGAAHDAAERLRREIAERHGLTVDLGEPVSRYTHGILDQRLRVQVHPGRVRKAREHRGSDARWVTPASIDEVATSGATRKALQGSSSKSRSSASTSSTGIGRRNA